MKSRYSLLLLLLGTLLSACVTHKEYRVLGDIESFIEDSPDSALAKLKTVDTLALRTKRAKAKYSLLLAMALDKCYIDTTNANVIRPAITFYKKRGTADEIMKAYYYQGIAYFNNNEFDKAIESFSAAEDLIPEANDLLYAGLIYSRISDLYNKTYNSKDELKYIELAADSFEEGNLDKYKYTTLARKGQALFGLRRYDEADDIFNLLLNNTSISSDLRWQVMEDKAVLLVARKNRDNAKALELFKKALAGKGSLRDINTWSAYAYTLASLGYSKESESLFSQLYEISDHDYSLVDIWKSAASESKGDYHNAFYLLQKSLTYQDSLMNIRLAQATAKGQMNYLALKNSRLSLEKTKNQEKLTLAILSFLFALVIAVSVFRTRLQIIRNERAELASIADTMSEKLKQSEENLEKIILSKDNALSALHSEINSKEELLSALRLEYTRMYKTQFKHLGELCETFLLANERADPQRTVYRKVKNMVQDISSDKAGQRRFEQMINKSLNNIMKSFRDEFPSYSEEEYRFISYLFIGFDATTLSIIFKLPSAAAVYMKKSRIKKAIQASQASRKQFYLEMLS